MAVLHPLQQPVRPASPEPPAAAHRRLGTVAIAVAIATVLLALAAGWLVRGAVTKAPDPAAPGIRPVDLGAVAFAVDPDWTAASLPAGVQGAPGSTKAFATAAGLQARVVVTVAPIDHPSLVPAALRALLADPLGRPQPARLGGLAAWHYGEQSLAGERLLELTVAPTSAGVVTVACVAGTHEWMAAEGCARAVRTVDLGAAQALEPDATLPLRAALPAAIERLGARRAELRQRLHGSTTRWGQSLLSGRLARVYERAAASLSPVAPDDGPGASVAARLDRAAAAYRRMAVVARRNQPVRFRSAGRRAARHEAAVDRALARLD